MPPIDTNVQAEPSAAAPFEFETVPRGPYPDAAAHLADHLLRVALCVERARWADGGGDGRNAERYAGAASSLDASIAERLAQTESAAAFPLPRLAAAFDLSPRAVQLLVAAAAPGLDAARARDLLGAGSQPDVRVLVELLAFEPAERSAFIEELQPGAPLVKWRLVRLGPARGWVPEGPLLLQAVSVPPRVHAFLLGHTGFDAAAFDPAVHLRESAPTIPAPLLATVERALFRVEPGRGGDHVAARFLPAVLVGAALSGKASAVAAAAAARGKSVLEVDLDGLLLHGQPGDVLLDALREARLQGALLLLRHGEMLEGARPELQRAVLSVLQGGAVPLALATRDDLPELLRRVPGAQPVRLTLPTREEQLELWKSALPETVAREADLRLEDVVTRYRLTPGDILQAGADAIARAALRGPEAAVASEEVVAAVRARLRHRLGDIAELIVTPLGWGDLVLRDEVRARIDELLATVKHQAQVMDAWGFARKVAYGRAVSALFSGPPGTGKTMVATLLAKEMGLELFRVDLSRVVSKWVGETEKNLGRAFDEAQNSQAVLLFDEADALFAKRTEVKSSNDRYANLEVNYLLQRLESFEGIVILTTNHQTAVDDAFKRRLRFRIEFPTPDEDERELLWRAMLPDGAPLSDDVDFRLLARKFSMAGGYIKNAVVRAAFLSAARGEPVVDHHTLLRAATLEWEDMGNLAMS